MLRRALPVLLALATLLGCSFERRLGWLRLPGSYTETHVERIAVRDGYLDAWLGSQRFFFADEPICRAVLVEGSEVHYVESGVFGTVDSEAGSCQPVGVGTLSLWRDTRPRAATLRPGPVRSQANWREIYRDADVALLRGSFPLAAQAGIRGDDVVAAVPAEEPCVSATAGGDRVGTLEYREYGPQAFTLYVEGRPCPVEGFLRPPGPF